MRGSAPKCVHCKYRKQGHARSLCNTCYLDVAIREQYPLNEPLVPVQDIGSARPLPDKPTEEPPGSSGKLAVLIERASKRVQLFHPDDKPADLD